MARLALTNSPVDIIAALSLDGSTVYTVQAEPMFDLLVHIDDSDSSPDPDRGVRIRPLDIVRAKAGSGGSLWVWAPGLGGDNQAFINVYEDV